MVEGFAPLRPSAKRGAGWQRRWRRLWGTLMAKKNEILLSIALEGDQEIKSKLQAVGEAGKKSLSDLEKSFADVGKSLGKLPEGAGGGGLQKALAPLLESSGLQSAVEGITGLLGKLGRVGGIVGPPAGIAAIGAELAKVREEAEKTETRLKALGASDGAAKRLRESGRQIDADPKALASGLEEFLPFKRRQELLQSPSDISENQFLAAQRALVAGGKVDRLQTPDAVAKANGFLSGLYSPHDLGDGTQAPGLVAGGLAGLSPSQRNRVARAIGGEFNAPINNADELDLLLQQKDQRGRAPVISPDVVFRALQRDEPAARAAAEKNRTLGDAKERVGGRLGDIKESLGEIFGGPSDKAGIGFQDTVSEGLRHIRERIDANAPLAKQFGESGRDLGERTGIPGVGRAGELLGTTEGFAAGILRDSAKGYGALGSQIGDAIGSTTVGKFLTDPGAIPGNVPQPVGPSQLTPEGLAATKIPLPFARQPEPQPEPPPPSVDRRSELGQPQAVQQPQQFGQADTSQQQFASLGTALQGIIDGLVAKINGINPTDTKVQGPVDGLGIRGEGESTIKSDVADASGAAGESIASLGGAAGGAAEDLKQLASALADAIASARSAGGSSSSNQTESSTKTVQAAAGGGMIRHLDDGGHLSGPGTSTSDSIPAMLSDGEYVIKASSARKIGRGMLDRLNAGGYAEGGFISRMWSRARRFADGGAALDGVLAGIEAGRRAEQNRQREEEAKKHLSDGPHSITYDPASGGAIIDGELHSAGDPLLDDPRVRQVIDDAKRGETQDTGASKSKYKSDFVGRFGHDDDTDTYVATGGLITPHGVAHFAGGGAVGNVAAFTGKTLHFPHFAEGGLLDMPSFAGPAPDLSGLGGSSGGIQELHPVTINMPGGGSVGPLMADRDVLKAIQREARDSANFRAGDPPGWFYGK